MPAKSNMLADLTDQNVACASRPACGFLVNKHYFRERGDRIPPTSCPRCGSGLIIVDSDGRPVKGLILSPSTGEIVKEKVT